MMGERGDLVCSLFRQTKLDFLCACSGTSSWIFSGHPLDIYTSSGHPRDTLGTFPQDTLGMPSRRPRDALGTPSGRPRDVVGSSSGRPRVIFGLSLGRPWVILGLSSGHPWDILRTSLCLIFFYQSCRLHPLFYFFTQAKFYRISLDVLFMFIFWSKKAVEVELVSKELNHFGGIASFFRDWAQAALTGGV